MPAIRLPLLLAAALLAATPAGTASASEGGGGALHLVEFTALVVPIIEGDRMSGRLRVKLMLNAADAAAAERITLALPALRERGLAAVSEYARLYASPFVPVDAARLAAEIGDGLRASEPAIGKVLLVEVAATPT